MPKHFEPPTYADALLEIKRLRAELAEYRAMFCPEGCKYLLKKHMTPSGEFRCQIPGETRTVWEFNGRPMRRTDCPAAKEADHG